jgi:hypothetical protein
MKTPFPKYNRVLSIFRAGFGEVRPSLSRVSFLKTVWPALQEFLQQKKK